MALFSLDTQEFRQIVPVVNNFTMDALLPTLDAVEADVLPRFLGDTVTEQIQALTETAGSPIETRAFRLARQVVGNLGFAQYLPFAEVQIEDSGVSVSAGSDRKPAFEYQTRRIERQCLDAGWRAMDELIGLVSRNPDDFPGWTDSPYCAEHQHALFRSASDFSKFYPINDRWLTFWALRPFIRQIEEDRGTDALARLEDELSEDDEGYDRLRRSLLRALAYESVLTALPNLSVELNGANVQLNYASQYSNISYYQPPTREHLDWVAGNLQRQCDLAWATFETGLAALNPPASDDDEDPLGFIGGDKLVFL